MKLCETANLQIWQHLLITWQKQPNHIKLKPEIQTTSELTHPRLKQFETSTANVIAFFWIILSGKLSTAQNKPKHEGAFHEPLPTFNIPSTHSNPI